MKTQTSTDQTIQASAMSATLKMEARKRGGSVEKQTLEDKTTEENLTPRERRAKLNGSMDKIKKETQKALPGLSQREREKLLKRMVGNVPLGEALDEMGVVGNSLDEAERLANEATPQGHSKNFKTNEGADRVKGEHEYSRSRNANATNQKEKKRDQERRRNTKPNW